MTTKKQKRTPDYSILMQERSGLRTCRLHINGDEIDEKIANGYSREEAKETSESNQFEKAIADGRIASNAVAIDEIDRFMSATNIERNQILRDERRARAA